MINYKISTLIWGKYNVYCHAELIKQIPARGRNDNIRCMMPRAAEHLEFERVVAFEFPLIVLE